MPLTVEAQNPDRWSGSVDYGELEPVSYFNPYKQETQIAAQQLFSLIYEGLYRYDYDAEDYLPLLASSSSYISENVVEIDLRTDVHWHDGSPFTVDDVVFTYNYIRDQAPSQISNAYKSITAERVSSTRVRFQFSEPTPDPLRFFEAWIIPRHYFYGYEPRGNPHTLSRHPVGTGPYRFEERTDEGHVTLVVNGNYRGARGKVEKLRMRRITDPGQVGLLAINGYHQLVLKVPPDAIPQIKGSNKFRFDVYASFGFYAFAYDCKHPILSDVRVRRALTLATNREGMLRQWFGESGRVVAGPFNKYSPYFDPELAPLPYSVRDARALLKEAGYKDIDNDGFLETPQGDKFSLELIYRTESVAIETLNGNLVENYVKDLEEIGIEVRVVATEINAYNDQIFEEKAFDIALVQWTFDPIYDVTELFVRNGNKNIVAFEDDEIDDLVRQFDEELDPERRILLMKTFQRILRDQSPYTFLVSEDREIAFHRSLLNTRVDPYYLIRDFPQWYIDSGF